MTFTLDTFNRPNVELVDVSATQGVEAITENGIIANGKGILLTVLFMPAVLKSPLL